MSERGSISGRSQGDEAPCAQSMQRQSPEKRTVEAGSGAAEHAGDIIQHRVRVALLLHEESAVWISERRLNTGLQPPTDCCSIQHLTETGRHEQPGRLTAQRAPNLHFDHTIIDA